MTPLEINNVFNYSIILNVHLNIYSTANVLFSSVDHRNCCTFYKIFIQSDKVFKLSHNTLFQNALESTPAPESSNVYVTGTPDAMIMIKHPIITHTTNKQTM